jgi:hypothetical protein
MKMKLNDETFILGISGKMGSGKTTVSKLIQSIYYDRFILRNFGDELKKEASDMYKYPLEWNYDQDLKKNKIINHKMLPRPDMYVREVLQWHGTEFRRSQDYNYWIKKMDDYFNDIHRNLIIDDVRFVNEADFVIDNGILFRIEIPGLDTGNHRSEIDLDDYDNFDYILKTDKSNPYFSLINANIISNIIDKWL